MCSNAAIWRWIFQLLLTHNLDGSGAIDGDISYTEEWRKADCSVNISEGFFELGWIHAPSLKTRYLMVSLRHDRQSINNILGTSHEAGVY